MTDEKWLDIGALGWLVRYELKGEYWLDFKAYEVTSRSVPGNAPTFRKRSDLMTVPADQFADSVDDAEPEIEGFVKWDGCCEMSIEKQHFCGAGDVADFAKVVQEIHKLSLLIPHVCHETAGHPVPQSSGGDT